MKTTDCNQNAKAGFAGAHRSAIVVELKLSGSKRNARKVAMNFLHAIKEVMEQPPAHFTGRGKVEIEWTATLR